MYLRRDAVIKRETVDRKIALGRLVGKGVKGVKGGIERKERPHCTTGAIGDPY